MFLNWVGLLDEFLFVDCFFNLFCEFDLFEWVVVLVRGFVIFVVCLGGIFKYLLEFLFWLSGLLIGLGEFLVEYFRLLGEFVCNFCWGWGICVMFVCDEWVLEWEEFLFMILFFEDDLKLNMYWIGELIVVKWCWWDDFIFLFVGE